MEGRTRREMRYRWPAAEVRCAPDVHATHMRCTAEMGRTANVHSTTAKMGAAAHPMRDSAAAEMWRATAAADVWRSTAPAMKSASAATAASSWRGVGGTRERGDSSNDDDDFDGRHDTLPRRPPVFRGYGSIGYRNNSCPMPRFQRCVASNARAHRKKPIVAVFGLT
jgi:hypothetical protein